MNRKVSFSAVIAVWQGLNDEEQAAVVATCQEFKVFAANQAAEIRKNTFFFPLSDNEVPPHFAEIAGRWRHLAARLGYTGPVAWRVREGFTLREHAPNAGPCCDDFQRLPGGNPTENCLAWWIPRWIPESNGKNTSEQRELLARWRGQFALPAHYLSSFGEASLLAGLIFAHLKRVGERVPLNCQWVRTDTYGGVGCRFNLGNFADVLHCEYWDIHGGLSHDDVGAFPLGVDLLESGELEV